MAAVHPSRARSRMTAALRVIGIAIVVTACLVAGLLAFQPTRFKIWQALGHDCGSWGAGVSYAQNYVDPEAHAQCFVTAWSQCRAATLEFLDRTLPNDGAAFHKFVVEPAALPWQSCALVDTVRETGDVRPAGT